MDAVTRHFGFPRELHAHLSSGRHDITTQFCSSGDFSMLMCKSCSYSAKGIQTGTEADSVPTNARRADPLAHKYSPTVVCSPRSVTRFHASDRVLSLLGSSLKP